MKFINQRPLLKKTIPHLFWCVPLTISWIAIFLTQNISLVDLFISGCVLLIVYYTGISVYLQLEKYD